jgi:type I restriction enzyme M protein
LLHQRQIVLVVFLLKLNRPVLETFDEIKEIDFNLNIPRYVVEEEEEIDVAAVQQETEGLESDLSQVRVNMSEYLKELNIYR